MKNNPNTKYALIALVVLIWGLIVYKIIKSLAEDDVQAPQTSYQPLPKKEQDSTYSLLTIPYPDPFSNNLDIIEGALTDTISVKKSASSINTPPMQTYTPPVNALPVEQPPAIKYNGYIYNPVTKKKTALITYNGRTMIVGVADKLDEKTRIIKIDNQELVFSFKGKKMAVGVGG